MSVVEKAEKEETKMKLSKKDKKKLRQFLEDVSWNESGDENFRLCQIDGKGEKEVDYEMRYDLTQEDINQLGLEVPVKTTLVGKINCIRIRKVKLLPLLPTEL
jgi:hypothetical protein